MKHGEIWLVNFSPQLGDEIAKLRPAVVSTSKYLSIGLWDILTLSSIKKMIQHIQEVSKMDTKNKEHVFAMLDAFIRQTKLQGVLN